MAAPARRSFRLPARIALLLAAIAGVAWLATLDFGRKISTNIIDLIPADEREPELVLLRRLASEVQARSIWCALASDGGNTPASPAAVEAFAAVLRDHPALDEVAVTSDPAAREALGRFLYERRFEYLLPDYLGRRQAEFAATGEAPAKWPRWLAAHVARELESFLARPEAGAFEDLITSDPLLLVPELARAGELLLPAAADAGRPALVWARLAASPLEDAGQQPVFDVLAAALDAGRRMDRGLELQWTGVNRFAAASKTRIRRELSALNALAVAGVLTVSALLLRRPWRVLHLVPIVLLSLLGGGVAVTALFERLHILVFVVGALLTGAAVDYGFHLFLHPPRWPGEAYADRLRRVIQPLLASCFTTVAGFSLLWFSDLPLLRHVGVFVSAGLLCALGAALLYCGQLDQPHLEARLPRHRADAPGRRRWRRLALILAVVAVGGGIWRLDWRDDVRELEVPAPDLQRNDQAVRALFGETAGRAAYVIPGADLAAARARLADLARWHETAYPGATLAGPGLVLPDPAEYEALPERLRSLEDFRDLLAAALERQGFPADSFQPFFDAWRQQRDRSWPDYAELAENLRPHLRGPLSLLLHVGSTEAWLLAVSDQPPDRPPPSELGVFEVNQLQSLNHLFERYRRNALRLSLAGLVIIGLGVLLLYGPRRGLRVFIIPAGACLVAFGLLGWMGRPLNLFHLLGAFLGVCLTHDYAIFSAHRREPGTPPPASIRLSALTTAVSFSVLALSRIPVVSALGSTVALIVLLGLAAVELERPRCRP